jgi:aspartyl-tRNA(Asn)/glutamyl-tRNA(Gln) amidotransferase subunit B
VIRLVGKGRLTDVQGRELLRTCLEKDRSPEELLRTMDEPMDDRREIMALVDRVLEAEDRAVARYRSGKHQAMEFLVGQVIRLSSGRADPAVIRSLLEERLNA